MFFSNDVDGRMIFDRVSESYHLARPGYPPQMYDCLYGSISPVTTKLNELSALEIGCGSGQATENLARDFGSLECVEPGQEFIKLLQKRFNLISTVSVHQTTFERFETNKKFDLIFSGCALHWIPKDVVLNKSAHYLKEGGWLAAVWNMPEFDENIYRIIDECIRPAFPEFEIPRGTGEHMKLFDEGFNVLSDNGYFRNCKKHIFNDVRNLNDEQLAHLIWSYVDISALGNKADSLYFYLEKQIRNSGQAFHSVKNCYPFAMGQKTT